MMFDKSHVCSGEVSSAVTRVTSQSTETFLQNGVNEEVRKFIQVKTLSVLFDNSTHQLKMNTKWLSHLSSIERLPFRLIRKSLGEY